MASLPVDEGEKPFTSCQDKAPETRCGESSAIGGD